VEKQSEYKLLRNRVGSLGRETIAIPKKYDNKKGPEDSCSQKG
jgi:hypothetical protein